MHFLSRLAALALMLAPAAALAQSAPNLTTGQVPTATQWNSYFAAKQDYNPNLGCAFSPCQPAVPLFPNEVLQTNASGTPSFSAILPSGTQLLSPDFTGTSATGVLSGNFSLTTSGQAQITNTTAATSPSTGAVTIAGGLGVGGAIFVGGQLAATAGTAATSPTTGALVVSGGVGVGGALWNAGGIVAGSPTGGNMGAGTINATNIYVDGSPVGTSSGDVAGPASSTAHDLVSYADTSGKTLEDAGSGTTLTTAASVSLSNTLAVGGALSVGGAATLSGTLTVAGDATINTSGAAPFAPPPNTVLDLMGPANPNNATHLNIDDVTNYGTISIRRADGTQAAPAAVGANEPLGALCFGGFDGSAWANCPARIIAVTTTSGGWSTSNLGVGLQFQTTAYGGTTLEPAVGINEYGQIKTFTDPGIPAISCGANATLTGDDNNGYIVWTGASGTPNCSITFAHARNQSPSCVAMSNDSARMPIETSTTATQFAFTTSGGGNWVNTDRVDYICIGIR